MQLPPERWVEGRRLYEDQGLSVADIAERLGVSKDIVYNRAKIDEWCRPPSFNGRTRPRPVGRLQRKRMIARLFGAFERQVRDLETRLAALDGREADDRDARMLATLAQTLDRLVTLDTSVTAQATGESEKPASDEEPDIDEFRRDLASRLETIRKARHRSPAAGTGPADD